MFTFASCTPQRINDVFEIVRALRSRSRRIETKYGTLCTFQRRTRVCTRFVYVSLQNWRLEWRCQDPGVNGKASTLFKIRIRDGLMYNFRYNKIFNNHYDF